MSKPEPFTEAELAALDEQHNYASATIPRALCQFCRLRATIDQLRRERDEALATLNNLGYREAKRCKDAD